MVDSDRMTFNQLADVYEERHLQPADYHGVDFTTQKWTELVQQPIATWPRWSRDGKYIYFHGHRTEGPALFRVRIGDRKIDRIASDQNFRAAADSSSGTWSGWAPDDSPLVLRDFGTQDIYALEWQTP
jgi:hypothetical protein